MGATHRYWLGVRRNVAQFHRQQQSGCSQRRLDLSHRSKRTRKIQNRIAQRKFREKVRKQRENTERQTDNARYAAETYTPPEPDQIDGTYDSGPPWGSISLQYIFSIGRMREQSQKSSDASMYNSAAVSEAGGGSSRLGLHLADRYARGSPVVWTARRT
ncbi:unnamed protein product [Zymoseptoria tritici ST99CH_3D7]|uniref:BZIP domain-containing protein n=2 Tax=Zymoseptoria tritici TaxID=1047171 RepID=A0A1X7RYI3_ZYMT9|nr:unnamed protein product [Zymoseptoria tritici ST99CH_3D7]SMR55326.1 unnamed protein product [Zymoseptoria tritici ST99CH_1E4]